MPCKQLYRLCYTTRQPDSRTYTEKKKKELIYMAAPSLLFHEAIKPKQEQLSFLHPQL